MSLKDLEFNKEYRSPRDNVAKELYIKALKESVLYKRAVGYFTSSNLLEIAQGIIYLLENGGKMQLIVSPQLNKEDIEAINEGYELREKTIEKSILDLIKEPIEEIEKEKLNLISTMIAENRLDIKIAFSNNGGKIGLYHEKMGIFYDAQNNKLAFSGSMNETKEALSSNYETIDVFNTWDSYDSFDRTLNKEKAFNELWDNCDEGAIVFEFPEAAKQKLLSYRKKEVNTALLKLEENYSFKVENSDKTSKFPSFPSWIKWRDYQNEATEMWEKNNYRGIFDMATGTGKTLTGLKGIVELSNKLENNLFVIIACPYQHLVEQWVEDIEKFNIKPIIGHSASLQRNWKERLEKSIKFQNYGMESSKFVCFICTNATYSSKFVQEQINNIKGDILLVVDEAHNFGATQLQKTLNERFKYRLALSATLDRKNDEEGTKLLYNFFGNKCITYDLEKAIRENMLTEYMYYPIVGSLSEKELEKYSEISLEISKCIIQKKNGETELNEKGKRLALKRSLIVAGASFKILKLKELLLKYKEDNHMLVYCGTGKVDNEEIEESFFEDDLRQIDAVTRIIGNELNMKTSQFTSKEDMEERRILIEKFSEGKDLQALIAIKCLDEGVNIPEIKTAFILASTTNPKEYIQRRGRVLRKAPGKEYAEIYDFITLPREIESISYLSDGEKRFEKSLAHNEAMRIKEFASLAINFQDGMRVYDEIREVYNLEDDEMYIFEGEE